MAAELKARITLDTVPFAESLRSILKGSKETATAVESVFSGQKIQIDTKSAAGAFNAVRQAASETVTEQKSALAALAASGQAGTKEYSELKAKLLETTGEARKLDDAMEQVNKEIESSSTKKISIGTQLREGLGESLKAGLVGGLIGGGVAGIVSEGIGAITEGFAAAIEEGKNFEQSMAGLQAVTGVSGEGLDDLGKRARELASQFGGSASVQVEAFKTILSKFGPDLAQTPEALGKVSENVNILAKAAGLDAKGAVDALSNSMLQFGVDASDPAKLAEQSGRFINVLAASAKVGAAEIPDVASAILACGVAAKGANISFEETNAALQALAVGGKVGAEAGTGLRNVIGKLIDGGKEQKAVLASMGLSYKELGETLTTKGIGPALETLRDKFKDFGTDAEKAAALQKLFGAENQATAGILLDGVDNIKAFTEGVTGTNEAFTQAEVNMNTFGERMDRLKTQFQEGLLSAYQAVAPALTSLFDTLVPKIVGIVQNLASAFAPVFAVLGTILGGVIAATLNVVVGAISYLAEGLKELAPFILAAAVGFGIYTLAMNAVAIGSAIATFATTTLGAAIAANPIGAAIVVVLAAVAAYKALSDAFTETAGEALEAAEAGKKNIEIQIQDNVQKKQSVASTKQLTEEFQRLASNTNRTAEENKRLKEIQEKLDQKYPDLIDNTKSFAENLNGVQEAGRRATNEMTKLTAEGEKLSASLQKQNEIVAGSKRNVAIEELQDVLGSFSLFEQRASRDFRNRWQDVRAEFEKSIYGAQTQEQVDAARRKIVEFINANQEAITAIDTKTYGELSDGINKVATSASSYINILKRQKEQVEDTNNVPLVPPVAPKAEDAEANGTILERIKKDYDERTKRLKEEAEKFTKEQIKSGVDEAEAKKITNKKLAEQLGQLQEQLRLELAAKLGGKFDDANRTLIAVDIKKLDKEKNETINTVASVFNALVLATDDALIAAAGKLKAGDGTKTFISNLKEQIKNVGDQIKEQITPDAIVIDAFEFTINAAKISERFETYRQSIKDKLATVKTDEERAALDALLADLDKAAKKFEADRDAALNKTVFTRRRRAAQEIADEDERTYNLSLIALDEKYKKELDRTDLSERERTELQSKYAEERLAIDNDYALKTSVTGRIRVAAATSITDALKDVFAEDTAAAEARNAELDAQSQKLKAQLKSEEISITDYRKELDKINKDRVQVGSTSIFEKFADSFKTKALKGLSKEISSFADDSLEKFKTFATSGGSVMETLGAGVTAVMGSAFASVSANGELSLKSLVGAMFNALQSLAPIIGALIYGLFVSSPNPLNVLTLGGAGAAEAAVISAVFSGLVEVARGALKLNTGIVRIQRNGAPAGVDTIPAWLNEDESVVTTAGTLARGKYLSNANILQQVNATAAPIEDIVLRSIPSTKLIEQLGFKQVDATHVSIEEIVAKNITRAKLLEELGFKQVNINSVFVDDSVVKSFSHAKHTEETSHKQTNVTSESIEDIVQRSITRNRLVESLALDKMRIGFSVEEQMRSKERQNIALHRAAVTMVNVDTKQLERGLSEIKAEVNALQGTFEHKTTKHLKVHVNQNELVRLSVEEQHRYAQGF